LDFNGEYTDTESETDDVIIESEFKTVYRLSTRSEQGGDKFPVSEETLLDPDFWAVFLEATEKTQAPFLKRAIESQFLVENTSTPEALKGLIGQRIREATTEGDKTLEKAVVVNLLKELRDALGDNNSLDELAADYDAHLKFHTQQGTYYYESPGHVRTYSNQPEFVQQYVDAKIEALDIDVAQLTPMDRIRLRIILQYYGDIIRGFSNKEHLAPLIKRLDKRIDYLRKILEVGGDGSESKSLTIVCGCGSAASAAAARTLC
jgi:hypothetical protein